MENGGELAPQRKFVVLLAEGESMLESQKKKKKKPTVMLLLIVWGCICQILSKAYPSFGPTYFDL